MASRKDKVIAACEADLRETSNRYNRQINAVTNELLSREIRELDKLVGLAVRSATFDIDC
jgi:hypothetical protein